MLLKAKRKWVWCEGGPMVTDWVGAWEGKRDYSRRRISTAKARCPICGKKFKPRVNTDSDGDKVARIPAHKKWVKLER